MYSKLFLLVLYFGSHTLRYIKMDKYYHGAPARQLVAHYSRPEASLSTHRAKGGLRESLSLHHVRRNFLFIFSPLVGCFIWVGDGGVKHDFYMTDISQKESMALNSLRAWTGEMCFFWEPRLTRVWHSSGFSRFTRGFFSGAFMRQDTTGELTAAVPYTFWYLVEATYDALTVSTTAFMRFLAAWIKEVALSSCKRVREKNFYGYHKLHLP